MKRGNMSTVIPEKVYHKEYGYGEVVRVVSSKIYVLFGSVQRIFDYPDAFDKGYLRTAREIDNSKKTPTVNVIEPVLNERKELKEKPSKSETTETFANLAKTYGVLDRFTTDDVHDRFRLGKEGGSKPLFLACSRVGWMCVYFDWNEKVLLESKGFSCQPANADKDKYDYKAHINAEDFDTFLEIVQKHLGR